MLYQNGFPISKIIKPAITWTALPSTPACVIPTQHLPLLYLGDPGPCLGFCALDGPALLWPPSCAHHLPAHFPHSRPHSGYQGPLNLDHTLYPEPQHFCSNGLESVVRTYTGLFLRSMWAGSPRCIPGPSQSRTAWGGKRKGMGMGQKSPFVPLSWVHKCQRQPCLKA